MINITDLKINTDAYDVMTASTAIKVKYIYSACVVISTVDIKILCDPWFTDGIYDGSWFQYPKIKDPINNIGDVDAIYVSHIHPDHYDSQFLKQYFQRFGNKKIFIADHRPNHLARKMRADGIVPTILGEEFLIGNTTIRIIPHITGSVSDIDSALIVNYNSVEKLHCVLNANDIIFDQAMRERIKNVAGDVDILLCGYTGAGPYPQTYFDIDDVELIKEAEKKKFSFFERYRLLVNCIDAKVNIPFAGKYVLGGNLCHLNQYRGVADPVEVLSFDKNAIILADNGGEIDTASLVPTKVRYERYEIEDVLKRIKDVSGLKMDYERLISKEEIHQLPLKRLFIAAAIKAISKSECEEDYFFCINLPSSQYAVVNANRNAKNAISIIDYGNQLPEPRSEIIIDPRYLFGLFSNVYHWNNAEIGSQYLTRRIPNSLNRKAQAFLNYLTI